MSHSLKEIPFQQGSTSIMFLSICTLFMFLSFLTYSFYTLFSMNDSLKEAARIPGYVLVLPNQGIEKKADDNQHDKMLMLSHMFAYFDDIIGYKKFTMTDYSSILPYFLSEKSTETYVEVRLAHQAYLNDQQFRDDLQGIIPGIKTYKRSEFFRTWHETLTHFAFAFRSIAFFMLFALWIGGAVLLNNCFKLHQDSIQTLRFLGASQGYITKKFQNFFTTRFTIGTTLGLLGAALFFIPFAWVLVPHIALESLFIQEFISLLSLGLFGYFILFVVIKILLSLQSKKLA